jgi:hypothetical protein
MVIRTKLQDDICNTLLKAGIPYYHRETAPRGEEIALAVDLPGRKRSARFWPTYVVTCDDGQRIVIQQKGRFVTSDRQRLVLLKQQHPSIEFRLVFSNSKQRISSTSPTTYAMWAQRYGFPFFDKVPSKAWIAELQGRTVRQVNGWTAS